MRCRFISDFTFVDKFYRLQDFEIILPDMLAKAEVILYNEKNRSISVSS